MAKRATVQPRWLDSMLYKWGITVPSAKGWYNICPMLQSGIPSTAAKYEPWDLTPKDYDKLREAIAALDHKHLWVVMRCYKPWSDHKAELEQYQVTDRTLYNWLQDAAGMIEAYMALGDTRVCGNSHSQGITAKYET